MAQADYVISANPTGLAMRTEVNQIFQAILTSNAGTVEPSTVSAGMLWGDTGNASTYYLKIRNHTNDGWVGLYAYDVATKTIQAMANGSTVSSLLSAKANLASPTFTGTVSGITKAMVGLSNVDNTSDANKPVSTAQQTALDLKANLASPALTGTPTAPTATVGDNSTTIATTAFAKAVSEANSIGVNQTWQNVTANRAIGTTYTNSTGKPILISVKVLWTGSSSNGSILIDNSVYVSMTGFASAFGSFYGNSVAVIPNGSTYKCTYAGSYSEMSWAELR